MSLIAAIVVVAVVAGLLAGGSLRAFEHVRLLWWALAPIGLALQGAPLSEHPQQAGTVLLVSYGVLLAFAAVNRRLPGVVLVFAGLALNLAVIAPNGGMPVDPAAARAAGADTVTIEGTAKHHALSSDDVLPFLADVIAVPRSGLVASFGDVVLYGGVVAFLITTMLGRARENVRPPARWLPMYRGKHLSPARRGLPRRLREAESGRAPAAAARWGTAR
jgi:Family of unknown function (DUF5317)